MLSRIATLCLIVSRSHPPSTYKLGTPIGMDCPRNSMKSDHMLPIESCSLACCCGLPARDQVHHLGGTIHYCHYGVLSLCSCGQIHNEVNAHFLPFGLWNGQGLETSLFLSVITFLQLAGWAGFHEFSNISCHALPLEVASDLTDRPLYARVRSIWYRVKLTNQLSLHF